MLGGLKKCWLSFVHWQGCVGGTLCWLPAEFGVFVLVQERLTSVAATAVVQLAIPGILRYCGWVPSFGQGLCLCGVVVATVVGHCGCYG